MFYCSLFKARGTPARLAPKRLLFLAIFYTVWPALTLVHWCCFKLDDLLFPNYKHQPVTKPLFILGNPRSGSTFLHRLLSRDKETFTSLTVWDIYLAPSVTQKQLTKLVARFDNRWLSGNLHKVLYTFDRATLGKIRIHPTSFFQPEEDENILLHIWDSYFISFLFPFMDELPDYQHFDEALTPQHKQRIMKFYKSMLQRHLYANPGKYFVSKNPAFSGKIRALTEYFPDANIIYLTRNPLQMLPSAISWVNYARARFTSPTQKVLYTDEVMAITRHYYDYPLHYLGTHPSIKHLLIEYGQLIQQPLQVIPNIYRRFSYPQPPALVDIVEEQTQKAASFRSRHSYSYKESGLSRKRIMREYSGVMKRFNFK